MFFYWFRNISWREACLFGRKRLSLDSIHFGWNDNIRWLQEIWRMFRFPVIVMGIRPVGLRLVEVAEDCRAADSGKGMAGGLLRRVQFLWGHWRVPGNHQGNPFPFTTGHEFCLYRFWLEKGRLEMLQTEAVEGTTLEMIAIREHFGFFLPWGKIEMTGKQDKMFESSPLKKSVSFFSWKRIQGKKLLRPRIFIGEISPVKIC